MSALTQWVDRLDARVQRVKEANRAHIPLGQYSSASVLLEQLQKPFAGLLNKHRFALAVIEPDAGVQLDEVHGAIRRLLRDDYQSFLNGHLTKKDTADLAAQIQALKAAIAMQTKVLDTHVADFRRRTETEIENVQVQVDLFKALSIADHTDDVKKLQLKFAFLMGRYGESATTVALEHDWGLVKQSLAALRQAVTFDERVGLSAEALKFVQRILAGPRQAPSLLEITPSLLAEIQKLRDFAGTVRIMRP